MVPAQRLISSEDQNLEKGGTKSFGGKVLASLIDKLITTQPSYGEVSQAMRPVSGKILLE